MPSSPNKLSQFWQELKRRNVVRVVTVYAGAAFVIIELINNITEPLKLPEWTPTLVIVLLCTGLIMAVLLSWIYDVTPDGIEKTGSSSWRSEETIQRTPTGWKVASYVSFAAIITLVILNIIPRKSQKEIFDKSIAVLPFRNDSPEEKEMYFINGTMESILDNLCKIQDLRVVSRTSVEQYRNNPKPIPVVGEEMNVSYVIEGSGLKHGDNIRLTIQLIDAINDKHLWSNTYNRKTAQIFELQSEIAQLVAGEISVFITPAEKKRIEKRPTHNMAAYEFYQKGLEEMRKYLQNNDDRGALDRSEALFRYSLDYDPAMAETYVELARVFWYKDYYESYYSGEYLDSSLSLLKIALSYDDQSANAYTLKGWIHLDRNENPEAEKEFDRALQFNPNQYEAYRGKASLAYDGDDLVNNIKYHHRAVELNRDSHLPGLLSSLGGAYWKAGFREKAVAYYDQALSLDDDSLRYYFDLMKLEFYFGFVDKAIEFGEHVYHKDTLNSGILIWLGLIYYSQRQYEESLSYMEKYIEQQNARGRNIGFKNSIGATYLASGDKERAEYYCDQQITHGESQIELDRASEDTYLNLALAYAVKGNREKVLHMLREFNKEERMTLQARMIKDIPVWDSFRDISEFNEIFDEVEAKYQAEHERVRQWLIENDML